MTKTAVHPTKTGWAQATEVRDFERLLFISGQTPFVSGGPDEGQVPSDIRGQCRVARVGQSGPPFDSC